MNRSIPSVSLCIALAIAVTPTPARADDAPPGDRAGDLYRRATRLYAAHKLAEAEPLYREAWALRQSYDIATNLGALELELGKPRRAAELLAHALRELPARARPEERAALQVRFAEARRQIGVLRVKSNVAGAEIFVDGVSVGRAPLADEVFVEAGPRVVEARLAGYRDTRLPLVVERGATLDVSLPLTPPPKRSLVPALVAGGVAVVAAGTGAALIGLAEKQRSDAGTLHDSIQQMGASCATPAAGCSALHAATSKADALGNAGVAAFVIAGAAAAGAATYLLWPTLKPGPKTPDVRASLGIGPSGGGAVIMGSF